MEMFEAMKEMRCAGRLEFQNGRSAMFEALKTRHPKFPGELPHPKYCGFEEWLTGSGYVYQHTLMLLSKRRLLAGSQRPIKTYTLSVPRNRFPDLESAQAVRSRSRAGLLTIFWRHLGAA